MAPLLSPTPETLVTRGWSDYALLDSGDGRKLERYGPYTVVRPEPQCFWAPRNPAAFEAANAVFDPQQEEEDAGRWRFDKHGAIDAFPLKWRDVRFTGRFTPFRHLAFFPEQAANWEWLDARVRRLDRPKILNLFGYTGVASLAAAELPGWLRAESHRTRGEFVLMVHPLVRAAETEDALDTASLRTLGSSSVITRSACART
jgi:23S rRNA (cytosine1962-C5)-methyltransferase